MSDKRVQLYAADGSKAFPKTKGDFVAAPTDKTTKGQLGQYIAEEARRMVKVDELDNIKDLTFGGVYDVTVDLGGNPISVGSMQVFGDSMHHVLTQVLYSHYTIDSSGNLFDTHNHDKISIYERSFNISFESGIGPDQATKKGQWTRWKPSIIGKSVKEIKISAIVDNVEVLNQSLAEGGRLCFDKTKMLLVVGDGKLIGEKYYNWSINVEFQNAITDYKEGTSKIIFTLNGGSFITGAATGITYLCEPNKFATQEQLESINDDLNTALDQIAGAMKFKGVLDNPATPVDKVLGEGVYVMAGDQWKVGKAGTYTNSKNPAERFVCEVGDTIICTKGQEGSSGVPSFYVVQGNIENPDLFPQMRAPGANVGVAAIEDGKVVIAAQKSVESLLFGAKTASSIALVDKSGITRLSSSATVLGEVLDTITQTPLPNPTTADKGILYIDSAGKLRKGLSGKAIYDATYAVKGLSTNANVVGFAGGRFKAATKGEIKSALFPETWDVTGALAVTTTAGELKLSKDPSEIGRLLNGMTQVVVNPGSTGDSGVLFLSKGGVLYKGRPYTEIATATEVVKRLTDRAAEDTDDFFVNYSDGTGDLHPADIGSANGAITILPDKNEDTGKYTMRLGLNDNVTAGSVTGINLWLGYKEE